MPKNKEIDETTELVRQSIITKKGSKNCIKDYSGEVFELTSDMLVKDSYYDKKEAKKLSGIAEGILRKYAKVLSYKN